MRTGQAPDARCAAGPQGTFLIGNLPRAIASLRPLLERRQGMRGTHVSSDRNHPNRAAISGSYFA